MEEREALQVVSFVMRKPQADLVETTVTQIQEQMEGPNQRGQAIEYIVRQFLELSKQPTEPKPEADTNATDKHKAKTKRK